MFESLKLLLAPDAGGASGGTGGDKPPAGQDPKPGGTPPKPIGDEIPDDPKVLRERFEKLLISHTEMKEKFDKRSAEEEKARKAAEKAQADALAEQGKFKELYDKVLPISEKVPVYEAALKKYLDAETAILPDTLKALIPEGDVVAQLDWIARAKASGAIKPRQAGDGTPPPPASGGEKVANRKAFDIMPPSERSKFLKDGGKVVD